MALIEQIKQWKNQGYSDQDIISGLKQQGVSPKEIRDALNQAKIKDAVSNDNSERSYAPSQAIESQQPQDYSQQDYSQQQAQEQNYDYGNYQYGQQAYPQNYEQGYNQNYNQGYGNYQGYEQGYGSSSMIDVAEQVFSERTKELKKEIDSLKEFKALSENRIKNISERLKKIESTINSLQSAILQKVGSYGQDLQTIKKEMGMIEDSFKKMTGEVAEKVSRKATSKRTQ